MLIKFGVDTAIPDLRRLKLFTVTVAPGRSSGSSTHP